MIAIAQSEQGIPQVQYILQPNVLTPILAAL